jgi:hypothetical protein
VGRFIVRPIAILQFQIQTVSNGWMQAGHRIRLNLVEGESFFPSAPALATKIYVVVSAATASQRGRWLGIASRYHTNRYRTYLFPLP